MTSRTNEPLHRTLTKKLSLSMGAGPTKSDNYDEFGNEADVEAVVSESDISSLQSSMGRSGQGNVQFPMIDFCINVKYIKFFQSLQ